MADKRAEARMKGYVGEACPECQNFHAGAERDVPEVRHVRQHDWLS